jgi:hypothetical protein
MLKSVYDSYGPLATLGLKPYIQDPSLTGSDNPLQGVDHGFEKLQRARACSFGLHASCTGRTGSRGSHAAVAQVVQRAVQEHRAAGEGCRSGTGGRSSGRESKFWLYFSDRPRRYPRAPRLRMKLWWLVDSAPGAEKAAVEHLSADGAWFHLVRQIEREAGPAGSATSLYFGRDRARSVPLFRRRLLPFPE